MGTHEHRRISVPMVSSTGTICRNSTVQTERTELKETPLTDSQTNQALVWWRIGKEPKV